MQHPSGLDPQTLALVYELEQIGRSHDLARVQQALGVALWRATMRHPALAFAVDFELHMLRLCDGGQRLFFETTVFPPRLERDSVESRGLPIEPLTVTSTEKPNDAARPQPDDAAFFRATTKDAI